MIDYTDPAALRELITGIDQQLWPTDQLFNTTELTRPLIEAARKALPYWIDRAEKAERAVERLASAWTNGHCIGFDQAKNCIEDCAACVKEWAVKEDYERMNSAPAAGE